jgi:glutathione S-transferase
MVQYLVDRYGQGKLQPKPGTPDHALYLQWSWFAEATFSRPLGEIVNHGREFPGDRRITEVVDEMKNRATLSLEAVAEEISDKQYLVAEEFSAADIMMGYTIMLADRLLDKPLPDNIIPYWERLNGREGFTIAQAK